MCASDLRIRSFLNRLHATPVNNDILSVHRVPTFIIYPDDLAYTRYYRRKREIIFFTSCIYNTVCNVYLSEIRTKDVRDDAY